MEMDGQGTFFSMLKFLQAAEKVGAAIRVRDVSILWNPSLNAQEDENSLQIRLVFGTLLKQRGKKNNV